MKSLIRFCAVLSTWATLHQCVTSSEVQLRTPSKQAAPQEPGVPPLKLFFHTPANGSRVDWPDVKLMYTLHEAQTGQELTQAQVGVLSRNIFVCFRLEGHGKSPSCSPLTETSVTIKDTIPGTWLTISTTLVSARRKTRSTGTYLRSQVADAAIAKLETVWEGAGDRISVFVDPRRNHSLPLCGESSCLDVASSESSGHGGMERKRSHLGNASRGPTSGLDSTLAVRQALAQVFLSYGITSMLDAGCGDVTWIPYVDGIDRVRYTGVDTAAMVIEDNRLRFEKDEGIGGTATIGGLRDPVFVQANLVEDVPASKGGQPFDLILVRSLMLHLPSSENFRLLQRLDESGAKLLVASTFLDADENTMPEASVEAHGHFINLARPPYCLRPPEVMFVDFDKGRPDHRLACWELDAERPLLLTGDCTASSWKRTSLEASRS